MLAPNLTLGIGSNQATVQLPVVGANCVPRAVVLTREVSAPKLTYRVCRTQASNATVISAHDAAVANRKVWVFVVDLIGDFDGALCVGINLPLLVRGKV